MKDVSVHTHNHVRSVVGLLELLLIVTSSVGGCLSLTGFFLGGVLFGITWAACTLWVVIVLWFTRRYFVNLLDKKELVVSEKIRGY